jgi:hypothetical protein
MDNSLQNKKDVRILVVDDVEVNLTILEGIILNMGTERKAST